MEKLNTELIKLLMGQYVFDSKKGLCSSINELYDKCLISHRERTRLRTLLIKHTPFRIRIQKIRLGSYWWPMGKAKPRLRFLGRIMIKEMKEEVKRIKALV